MDGRELGIRLDECFLAKVRKVLDSVEGLEFAVLFGSLATMGESYHDIDIAVKVSWKNKYSTLCKIVEALSKSLRVPEEWIDLVDLDRADLELKKEVVVNGIIILDKTGYKEKLVKELNTSYPEYSEHRRMD